MICARAGGERQPAGSIRSLSIEIPRQHQPRVDIVHRNNPGHGSVRDEEDVSGVPAASTHRGSSSRRGGARKPEGTTPNDHVGSKSELHSQQVRQFLNY